MSDPYFHDGWQTLIAFELDDDILLKEKSVMPPGADTGGPIDTTTMRNEVWRTQAAKHLISLTQTTATVVYASGTLAQIRAMLRVHQTITVTFPDGEEKSARGWIDKFTPSEHVVDDQPTAQLTIEWCLTDEDGVEAQPDFYADES